jgi:hypothetical protein
MTIRPAALKRRQLAVGSSPVVTIVAPAISRKGARNQLRREKTDALQRPVVSIARIAKIGWVEMTRQGPTKKDRGQPVRGSPRWAKLMSVLPPSAQNMLTGKNRGGEGRGVEHIVYSHSRGGHGGDGGIRTLDRALQPYNGLANRRLQPLGHVSRRNPRRDICPTHPPIASARRPSLAGS